MISSFRRYLDTWYVRAFFLLMMASFVLWGVGDMLRAIGTSSWVAKVGGTAIELPALDHEYRQELAAASRDLPSGQEASLEMRRTVARQALDRLISQTAMTQTLHDMRIVVPDAAVADATRKLPAFRSEQGNFDRAKFEAVLRQNNLTEAGYVALMRDDLAQAQLMDAVTAANRAPASEIGPIFASQYEKRSADIAAFPLAAAAEPPATDDATVRRWYDNHPDYYATPEYRRVTVAILSPHALASDVSVSDKDLRDAYEQHLADYTTIARRSAQILSVPDEAGAKSLAARWKEGATWEAMNEAAKAANASAIVEDKATEKEFPDPDLAKAVFSTPINTVSDPIKGALGWFVVRVTAAVEGGSTPFEQVKDTLRERLTTEKALDLVYDRANKIDGILGNGSALESLPKDLGLTFTTATFDHDGTTPDNQRVSFGGEDELRTAIIAAAFAAQKGDQPHLTEVQTPSTGGSGYYALSVDDVIPAGEKPFDAVRDTAAQDWRADQRRHEAETAAAAMLAAVKGGKSFSDAARDAGVTPRLTDPVTRRSASPSMPRDVQAVLFSLKKDEPTMVETPEGFVVAIPVEIIAPDPSADQASYEQLRTAVNRTIANDLAGLFTEALRLRANPRINESALDQLVQP
jgi:peptidyl-prolyl cis-trans isomerase D